MRRLLPTMAAAFVLIAGVAPAPAQDYPTQNIKMIISFGPGGGSDIIGRIVAQRLQEKLGQNVVVENRAGAGGLLGNEAIANSPKDGYTIGVQTAGQIIAAAMTKQVRFDAVEAFDWIGQIATAGLLIVVRPDFALQGHQVAGRGRQGQSRQDQLREPRLRRDAASVRRAVQAGRRHQHDAGAVPHFAGSACGAAVEEHRRAVRHHHRAARPGRVRPGARARRSPARTASRRCRTCRPRPSPASCRTTTSPPGTACSGRRACRSRWSPS